MIPMDEMVYRAVGDATKAPDILHLHHKMWPVDSLSDTLAQEINTSWRVPVLYIGVYESLYEEVKRWMEDR